MSKATHFLRAFLAATVILVGAQHSVVLASEEDGVTDQGGSGSGEPDAPDTPDVPDAPGTPGTPGTPDVPDGGGTDDPDTDTGNTDDDDSGTGDSGDDDTSGGAGTNDDSNEDSGDVSSAGNTPNVQTSAANGPLGTVTVEAVLQQVLGATVDLTAIVDLRAPPATIVEQVSSSTAANAIVSNVSTSTAPSIAKIQSQVINLYNDISVQINHVDGLRVM